MIDGETAVTANNEWATKTTNRPANILMIIRTADNRRHWLSISSATKYFDFWQIGMHVACVQFDRIKYLLYVRSSVCFPLVILLEMKCNRLPYTPTLDIIHNWFNKFHRFMSNFLVGLISPQYSRLVDWLPGWLNFCRLPVRWPSNSRGEEQKDGNDDDGMIMDGEKEKSGK